MFKWSCLKVQSMEGRIIWKSIHGKEAIHDISLKSSNSHPPIHPLRSLEKGRKERSTLGVSISHLPTSLMFSLDAGNVHHTFEDGVKVANILGINVGWWLSKICYKAKILRQRKYSSTEPIVVNVSLWRGIKNVQSFPAASRSWKQFLVMETKKRALKTMLRSKERSHFFLESNF